MTTAQVELWGSVVGYVSMGDGERFARFEYDPQFAKRGIELSPLEMKVRPHHLYQFMDLPPRSFHGLPGLLADSLPDRYGSRLIDVWLAQSGRKREDFNSVDRLCYTGVRGMGALEYRPATLLEAPADRQLEVQNLLRLASLAFASKETLRARLSEDAEDAELLELLSLGTSAGGARAKAVIAFHPESGQVRSGQGELPQGFEHWLIKFDGVEFNGDWGVADPVGYGLLEYSYYRVARLCGIDMMESRLFVENGRSHFMTRRFDRFSDRRKKFVQTLAALAHFDFWQSGQYSYEQVMMTIKRLSLPKSSIEEQFRRTVFNLVGANQDDHVKNIAFMMDRQGKWSLSPAYDLCHAAGSPFTKNHQLSLNGKTNDFVLADLKVLAEYAGLPRGREKRILEEVLEAFSSWPALAQELEIPADLQARVLATRRMDW